MQNQQKSIVIALALLAVVVGASLFFQQANSARLAAREMESGNQMKMLVIAIHQYAGRHRGDLPEKLGDVEEYMPPGEFVKLLKNPFTGDFPGYEYLPAKNMDEIDPSKTIILYQLRNQLRVVDSYVGFADGRIHRTNQP